MGILEVAAVGATETEIVNESSLSRSQVEQCLSFLQQSDLLRREASGELFRLTRKGAGLVADYERIDSMVEGRILRPISN